MMILRVDDTRAAVHQGSVPVSRFMRETGDKRSKRTNKQLSSILDVRNTPLNHGSNPSFHPIRSVTPLWE